jgi:uncharacterized protein YeaO (DUF488 family)
MPIMVKRVYERATPSDGTRILVDRLWPRGLSKEKASVRAWLRELAPSDTLRKWFHARPEAWPTFRKRYLKELTRSEAAGALEQLHRLAGIHRRMTLLFASKNEEHNNAVVLKQLLEGLRKPPTGTGPGAMKGTRTRQTAKRPQ